MLHVASELLVKEPIEPNDNTPIPVQQHVSALDAYTSRLLETNELSPEAAAFAHLFARRHDSGYGANIDMMQTDGAIRIVGEALEAVGSSINPRSVADYLHHNADNYMAARIIGHGVLSLVENSRYFEQEQRLSRQKALGLASILSAHHSGFPITMVSQFLKGDAIIPAEARSAFFIDDGDDNPELIRHRLVEFGANKLGISKADALQAAVLGYALDRLTAGSTPDKLEWSPHSGVELFGGEVIQKKYGLVAGDLDRDDHGTPLIAALYHTVLQRIQNETEAALAAADAANAPDIRQFVEKQQSVIYSRTLEAQQGAMTAMYTLGLVGKFADLHSEREKLLLYAQCVDNPNILYALATYNAVISSIYKQES
ncbi:MAG TPA: hypothetical protein VFT59_05910 [Candidatus Saccharimonadales bacterium]|nr:hypothetical protein [Candidatus Saccharimonadales bacterium]